MVNNLKQQQMKNSWERNSINENTYSEKKYQDMFLKMGFAKTSIEVSHTNGQSVYVTVSAKVLDSGKMYHDCSNYILDGVIRLVVRISDHDSNLEKICKGVCGNKLSIFAFKLLISRGVIAENN